jgi:hypothetical protein
MSARLVELTAALADLQDQLSALARQYLGALPTLPVDLPVHELLMYHLEEAQRNLSWVETCLEQAGSGPTEQVKGADDVRG